MRALFIDATNQQIKEIDIDGSLRSIQELVGGYIERAPIKLPHGDTLYLDEEGLLKGYPKGFVMEGARQSYAGNGVVLGKGDSEGNETPAQSTVDDILARLYWVEFLPEKKTINFR